MAVAVSLGVAATSTVADARRPQRSPTPLTLVVDLSRQHVQGYRGTDTVWSSKVSSGKSGHRTPTGVFSVIQKRRQHYSNIYNGASMPHMQRLTWSGIALHGGPVPGYPASHGCVRLPYGKAKELFGVTSMSDRVIVTNGSPRPTRISHPALWDMLPPGSDDETVAAPPVASADSARTPTRTASVLDTVIGVLPARAETIAQSAADDGRPPLTRVEVRKRREASLERLAAEAERAVLQVTVAKAVVETRSEELDTVTADLAAARRSLDAAIRDDRRWQRRRDEVARDLTRLFRSNLDIGADDPRFEELAGRELDLELALEEAEGEVRMLHLTRRELDGAVAGLSEVQASRSAALETARADLDAARRAASVAEATRKSTVAAVRFADEPVHMLASRESGKLYARQGFQDVLEADVTFAEPDAAIGTHVFTAIEVADDDATLAWSAITVADGKYDAGRLTARTALDRLKIPPHTRQKITELMSPGSSLIVTDRKPSHETGKGTDFIVLTR